MNLLNLFLMLLAMLAGCSAGSTKSGTASAGANASDASTPTADSGSDASAATGSATAAGAATNAAQTDPTCTAISPFYWEIGDATTVLGSGSVGGTRYTATSTMGIASASKLVFGAYVVERFKDKLGDIDLRAMTMQSGYTSLTYGSCLGAASVKACFDAGKNSTLTAADVDHFFYNGGHFQKYAVDLGLGGDDDQQLAANISALLGNELQIAYSSPQLAGGMRVQPTDYAHFLQKLLRGQLALGSHLGEQAVCTLPGAACPTAISSPAPAAWHYSYAHWVEDDATGDGAFSSPGAFGFYPWIDAHKHYYGIVARQDTAVDAYKKSVICGQAIRKAFLNAH